MSAEAESKVVEDEKTSVEDRDTWESLNIPRYEQLSVATASLGWIWPLPVQVQTLPLIFGNPPKSIIAQAPTGKGDS
jgi:superfamily II DNA/RNA helicase